MEINIKKNIKTDTQIEAIAAAKNEIGKIYFNQGDYVEAHSYFKSVLGLVQCAEAVYYISHMAYFGKGLPKDVDMAITGYEWIVDCEVQENINTRTDYDICIVKANNELGRIYALEPNFINKQKALNRLNRAKDLGFEITDYEIDLIINSIDDIADSTDSAKSEISTVPLKILIVLTIIFAIICIPMSLVIPFYGCVVLLIILLIIKKIITKINYKRNK